MSALTNLLLRHRRLISVAAHAVLIVVANLGAFWLRFDGRVPDPFVGAALQVLPGVLIIRLLTFVPFRLFEGLWRYTSLWDLRSIVLASLLSTAMIYVLVVVMNPAPAYPRSIYILDTLLLVCLLSGIRLSRRIYGELRRSPQERRVLVYGAGDAGEMIVRDMRHNALYGAEPVGFIDDDHQKRGRRIHGVPVLGGREDLARIIKDEAPEEVLIAMPTASREVLRGVVRALEPHKLRITTLPSLSDLVGKRVDVGAIRQLKVEDLLSRAPIGLDPERVRAYIEGETVLVTGAGGSIGSELCRQILRARPARLVLFERYENALFVIHNELTDRHPSADVIPAVGDVTDGERLDQVFASYRPSVVFHAAAHKHVPLMEQNPSEAVKNNVRGTRLLADASLRWGVERFLLISTDKAVNPSSVMGATKRVAERIVQRYATASGTSFACVRFGNVLGSNGSVVPTFLAQIKAGGPVTVTHPEMRRYFMLIPEAVHLVLHAAALKGQGSVYVLDMGDQIFVQDMARELIRLAGFRPDEDIEIVFTGVRPGEKLFEELVGAGECTRPTDVEKVQQVHPTVRAEDSELTLCLERLEAMAAEGDDAAVMRMLRSLMPTLVPAGQGNGLNWTA